MDEKKLKIIKSTTSIILGVLFVFTALYSYWGNWSVYQLTFLSNFVCGVFLIISGILFAVGKNVPEFLFLDFSMLLLIVIGVCVAFWGQFSFSGSLLFLHALNPILMLLFYLFISNQEKSKNWAVATVIAMPLAYLIFALIFGTITGNYIYFFLEYSTFGVFNMILVILVILVGLIAIGFGLLYLNKLIHKHILKEI